MRQRWWKKTARQQRGQWGAHAVSGQVSGHWSLDFNWTALFIHTYLTICVLNYEVHKTFQNTGIIVVPVRECL